MKKVKVAIHPFIKSKQIELMECVNNKIRIFINIHWKNIVWNMNSLTLKNTLMDSLLVLQRNYTNYFKIIHNVKFIIIKEIISKNPHIKQKQSEVMEELIRSNPDITIIVDLV